MIVTASDTAADEPAFIVYTSGTTGKPKGIVHAHRWIVALGDLNRYRLPPQQNDVIMATGEWSFISALGHNLLFPLRNGVTGAILSATGFFGRPTAQKGTSSFFSCPAMGNATAMASAASASLALSEPFMSPPRGWGHKLSSAWLKKAKGRKVRSPFRAGRFR